MGMPLLANAGLFAPEQDGGALPAPPFSKPGTSFRKSFFVEEHWARSNVPKMTKGEKHE
jgi:hypothetical protein